MLGNCLSFPSDLFDLSSSWVIISPKFKGKRIPWYDLRQKLPICMRSSQHLPKKDQGYWTEQVWDQHYLCYCSAPNNCASLKYPRSGWTGSQATWSSGRCTCSWQGVGTRWSLRTLATQTILWFYNQNIFFISPGKEETLICLWCAKRNPAMNTCPRVHLTL